ncbi:MAG: sugar transferase [Lachnospiraceae bacterium]|nr:sugar transferase [Lachnospiraceae bacterium]
MTNSKIRIIQTYGMWLIDVLCMIASFDLSKVIRYGTAVHSKNMPFDRLLIIFILFSFAYNFFLDWNHDYLTRGAFGEFQAVFKFNAFLVLTVLVYVFAVRLYYYVSRLLVGRFVLINFLLMLAMHLLMKKLIKKILSADLSVNKVFIIAEEDVLPETIERIRRTMGVNTQIVGAALATDEPADRAEQIVDGITVAPGLGNITETMIQTPFDEVFINTPDISQRKMRKVIHGFEEMGVTCHYNLELPDIGAAITRVGSFGEYSVITYHKTYISAKKLLVKRAFDILGGLVGLFFTGILLLFLGPAIKLDSPGPIVFSQVRVGKNGRRFKIYKFRSMYQDAEARKKELMEQNEMSGYMFKMENDPRITKIGAFLRKTSLDEFPQFLNVLKGDMSLVGTRPPTEAEFEQYNEHYRRRISMTPGLTGMWQVSGRSDITDFDEVVRLDLEYIDNWSLTLDLKILLQTVGVLFNGHGAK